MSLRKLRVCLLSCALTVIVSAPVFADYTASGKFLYEDRQFGTSGFTGSVEFRPIRYADVRIVADSSGTALANGATNANGEFSITVPGSASQLIRAICQTTSSSTPGLSLKVLAATSNLTATGSPYSMSSAAIPATGTGPVAVGTLLASASSDAGKAFNIWDVAYDGMEFAAATTGSFPALGMTMLWSRTHRLAGAGSFAICSDPPSAYIDTGSAQDDAVIAHRFGHFLLNAYSKQDEPCPERLPQFFFGDGAQDVRLAWSEGAAMYLGAMIRKFKGYARPDFYFVSGTNGSSLAFSMELEGLSSPYVLASRRGSANMLAVAAALWDITDDAASNDSSQGTDDDPLSRPFPDVWRVISSYLASAGSNITVERFWDGWFALGNGSAAEMQTTFVNLNGIETMADARESDNSASAAPLVPPASLSLAGGPKVVVNEIDTGNFNTIELYNAGDLEADLTGWTVVASRSGAVATRLEIPSYKLQRGGFVRLVIGSGGQSPAGAGRYNVYFRVSDPAPWKPGMDGACALRDRNGNPRDFVRWGDSSEFPVGEWKGSNPASPGFGRTLGRNYAGTDTDSGGDWSAQDPSPGTFNLGGPEVHHTLYPAGDVDYVAFDAMPGRTYVLEALNLGNGADTVLQLLGTDGTTVLATSDDIGSGRGSRIGWTAPGAGRYFLAARRYEGPSNPAEYGSYDLRVIESPVTIPVAGPETRTVSKAGGSGVYQTIADAIADAGNGDTVQVVDSGTYTEAVTISGKTLTLKAALGQHPVIDGRQVSGVPTLSISRNKSVRVDGLTILGSAKGIQVTGTPAVILNTTVARSTGQAGDGIAVAGADASATVVNCTAYGNAQAGIVAYSSASLRVVNSIAFGNNLVDVGRDSGTAETNVVVKNSVVAKGTYAGKDGNINSDPKFVNAGSNDFHLQSGSPCIDKGDGSDADLPGTDAEGYPRSLDGDGNGSALPDMGAFEYVSPASLTSASVFPQIAAGGEYRTTMFGVNTSAQSAIVNLSLTRSDGNGFPVTIAGRTSNTFSLLLPPAGTTRLEATSSSGLAAGYARFQSNVQVNGSALFQTVQGANVVSEAGVGLSKPTRSFTVYIDNTEFAYSGYAVANTGNTPANLSMTLRDRSGAEITTKSRTLGAGEHFARFAADPLEFGNYAPAGFEGSIECTSDREVVAVALRYDNEKQDVFSTIPVLVNEAATTLYFPQVADGGGYRTNFILVNPNAVPATATLEFFASDGNPLTLSIGGTGRTTYDVQLSAKGVLRFLTDGTSAGTKVGWVRVSSAQPLGGSAIFQTRSGPTITSEAGVASSPVASRFTTYVESVGFTQSGLAICNTSADAVGITLNLRDSMGNVVDSVSINLPRLGHVAKFFSEEGWFGSAYSEFQGTLEVVASAPVSAVALRYDNEAQQVFATLPVIVIP